MQLNIEKFGGLSAETGIRPPPLPHVAVLQARLSALADDVQILLSAQQAIMAEMHDISQRLDAEIAAHGAVDPMMIAVISHAKETELSSKMDASTSEVSVPQGAASIEVLLADALTSSEQLTLIKGIDAGAASLLNSQGINSFADIASLTPEDVKELGALLGSRRRIAKQGWIEQAAMLAAGTRTAHVNRRLTAVTPIKQEALQPAATETGALMSTATVVDLAAHAATQQRRRKASGRRRIASVAFALLVTAAYVAIDLAGHTLPTVSSTLPGFEIKTVAAVW